ncbi:MAG: carbon-nitrogen hydrolase family protein [Gemmatimonadota bacterium]
MSAPVRVCGVQTDPRLGEPETNAEVICDRMAEAESEGARLVVFPEAALTGYVFDSRKQALDGSLEADSAIIRRVRDACRDLGVWSVFGAIERVRDESGPDRLYNTAFLSAPSGELHRYHKVHTLCLGVDRFTIPGDEGFRVWDLPFGRIGLNICYDGSFPESARALKLLGAQLIVLPTNWPDLTLKTEQTRLRALENHVYYLAVNRVGVERGVTFAGGSVAAGPRGELLAEGGAEALSFVVEMDLASADANRVIKAPGSYEFDYVADRRPDLYAPLRELTPEGEPTGSRRAGE